MKKVLTEICDDSVKVTVSSAHGEVVLDFPYTMVHPRTAVQIAGILASDPCVQPIKSDDTQN